MSFTTFVAHQALHTGQNILSAFGRTVEQSVNMIAANEVPPAEALFHLGITGQIDERSMQEALLRLGISVTVAGDPQFGTALGAQAWIQELWNQHYFAQQHIPTPQESFVLTNRGLFSEANLDRMLERNGFADIGLRQKLANLRYEVPGSSDLVRFSVRHVFEPDLIKELGYNDEFRPILDYWHRTQGLNYPLFSGPFRESIAKFESELGLVPGSFLGSYESVGLKDPTWAQAYWWSHWVLPSPSQAYEMYFRFRPGRDRTFDPPFARGLDFGLNDLNLLLRANDYPPRFRPLLAAIAHRIPGIRFLRQLRSTEVFTQENVKELLLRQGYSDGDAAILAQSVELNERNARRKTIEQQAKGQLARYWEQGIIDDDTYRDLLIKHGMQPDDARDTLELARLDLESKRVVKITEFVRRQFLSGGLDNIQALQQLHEVGVLEPRASQFVEDWSLEIKAKHKQVAAGKLVQWACKGLITVPDLQRRLLNLGYLAPDIAGIIGEAELCQAGLAAKAARQQAAQERQSERSLVQQQKTAAQAIATARRQLASHGSPSQLRKWFCAGHVGAAEVYSRLRFLGWPDIDITRLLSDCKSQMGGGSGGKRGGSVIGSQPTSGSPASGGGTGGPAGGGTSP